MCAVALIAEARQLGIAPEKTIDRGLGIEDVFFKSDTNPYEPGAREKIIRNSLGGNCENLLKLGYKADYLILESMREDRLPVLGEEPWAGWEMNPAGSHPTRPSTPSQPRRRRSTRLIPAIPTNRLLDGSGTVVRVAR